MAIGVLNLFDATTDDLINGVILLRKIPLYNLDCLQMAVEADCQKFVALTSVQNLLTGIWYGKVSSKSGVKATLKVYLMSMDIFCCFYPAYKVFKSEVYLQKKYVL
jgi:hypothetical protein